MLEDSEREEALKPETVEGPEEERVEAEWVREGTLEMEGTLELELELG